MNFGIAIEALKQGDKVARRVWNDKMFIYLVKGRTLKHEDFKNEAAEAVKLAYKLEGNTDNTPSDRIVNSHIDMKNPWGEIVVGWTASQADILAEDWVIVE